MDEYEAFAARLREFVEGKRLKVAAELTDTYWRKNAGSWFHRLADVDNPNIFTEKDIVAVSTLSVEIPPRVSIWLLSEEGMSATSELLSKVPRDIDIWDGEAHLATGGPLDQLWGLLGSARWPEPRSANGMGATKKSKLLATKRPRLVPIWDRVLREMLPAVDNYWEAFRHALSGDGELRLLLSVASSTGAPEDAGLLRRIDALLWMIGTETDW